MSDFVKQLEEWAAMLNPILERPRVARIKAGRVAYTALLRQLAPKPGNTYGRGMLADLTGTPVDVLDANWPPNLVVAMDKEGNALSAWILNDAA